MGKANFLDGQMLIAMPGMGDLRFERSVIYVCAHSEQGAMGLIVNKSAPLVSFADLLGRDSEKPLRSVSEEAMHTPILFGGPVETGRGFVLHTSDYFKSDSSLPITERIALTATLDILHAIAGGKGPRHSLLTLGYSGWAPGQLEDEIRRNGWLNCDADEALLFNDPLDDRYEHALAKLGVDPAMLSSQAGHG
ncbi:MAG: YqgE/AlgH family protein [Rhizobiales bacterium]|nr:YqgE/AlgH family protein [Hyphomicrobiales bacterium]